MRGSSYLLQGSLTFKSGLLQSCVNEALKIQQRQEIERVKKKDKYDRAPTPEA